MSELPIPAHFEPSRIGEIRRVPYQKVMEQALLWKNLHRVKSAATDKTRIALMLIDTQITFCFPDAELPVQGALEDCRRTVEFIYRNLGALTDIHLTMDTHLAMQIFHPIYLVDEQGNPAPPHTFVTREDVEKGKWRVNPAVAYSTAQGNYAGLQNQLLDYTGKLESTGKFSLAVWPFHSMLMGIGHAIVPAIEEAVFFHTICRGSQARPEIKGGNPLTENYSIFRPEVLDGPDGRPIAQKNSRFLKALIDHDAVFIAGQAKSHCVAWSIDDLLTEINAFDPSLCQKVYLIEDMTSPVVIPGVVDFTQQANEAFDRFKKAGMHVVSSDQPLSAWPDLQLY